MSNIPDEARDEIVSQRVAHEEFVEQHRHEAHEAPSSLDADTLERLTEPS